MSIARPVLSTHPKLAAGQRTYLVTIEQGVITKAPSGAPVTTWSMLRTEWMARTETRANERFASNQVTASTETVWEAPYTVDMDPDVLNIPKVRRLVYKSRTYDITAASIIGTNRGIEFLTIAKVTG